MLTLTNRIDMRPGAVPLVIHLGQYDSDFSLVFELYSSAGNFTVESGTTAMIRGTKTDGNAYDADATIDISAKTVTVTGSEQMTAAKGRNVYELVLTKSGKVLSTANFILDVERAAMDADTIASESVLKELNAIIAGAATATEAAADAASAADRAEDAADSVSSASAQIATNAADIADLKEDFEQLEPGLSAEAKAALLACFAKVAWIDEHGQDYYDALYNALYDEEPEPIDPTRIYHLPASKAINTVADVINTGLYIGSDSTFTILLDITIDVNDANRRRLVNGSSLNPNNENQAYGINVMSYIYNSTRRISADFNGTEISAEYDPTSSRRVRYVGRYDSTSKLYKALLYIDDTKSIDTNQTITVLGTPTSPLTIGGRTVDSTVSGVIMGTVRSADVYSRVLSDAEVAAFLGVESL